MAKRVELEQELFKRVKTARALTRLKHALVSEDEVNETVDKVRKHFTKIVQNGGKRPRPVDIDSMIASLLNG